MGSRAPLENNDSAEMGSRQLKAGSAPILPPGHQMAPGTGSTKVDWGRLRGASDGSATGTISAALRSATGHRIGILVTEPDAAFGDVVDRQLEGDPVARQNADSVFFHFAGDVGGDDCPVVQRDAIPGVRKDFGNDAFYFNQIFFFLIQRLWFDHFFPFSSLSQMNLFFPLSTLLLLCFTVLDIYLVIFFLFFV